MRLVNREMQANAENYKVRLSVYNYISEGDFEIIFMDFPGQNVVLETFVRQYQNKQGNMKNILTQNKSGNRKKTYFK